MKNLSKYFAAALVSLSLVACSSKAPDVASSSSPSPSPSASASAISSNDQKTLIDKAASQLKSKDFQGTLDTSNQMISQYPDDPVGYFFRGTAESGLKNYQSSLDDMTKVLKLKPPDALLPGVYLTASIDEYNLQQNVDDAKQGMQKVIDLYKSAGKDTKLPEFLLAKMNAGEPVDIFMKPDSSSPSPSN